MKFREFSRPLVESTITKPDVESILRKNGYENLKVTGNKIHVLVQIPDGEKKTEFRKSILNQILGSFKREMPKSHAQYSADPGISSIGGVVFPDSPVQVVVKDSGKQGEKSAGVANEIELASMIESVVEKYGTVDVTFEDPRGKKLTIKNCTDVDVAGRDTAGGKKADVVLTSDVGALPISIKKLDADMWESADNMFGARARKILDKLVKEKVVSLKKIGTRSIKSTSIPVYELSKEIVMEPTPEEALRAIFGTDLNPKGGVVIQTFKPEHFTQDENKVKIDAHAVIANKDDIPESHVMVWLLRNDKTRNGGSLGIAGIRPLGVTLVRGLGRKGDKNVVLVDTDGNVIKRPSSSSEKPVKKSSKLGKKELEPGSVEATRKKRD